LGKVPDVPTIPDWSHAQRHLEFKRCDDWLEELFGIDEVILWTRNEHKAFITEKAGEL
jgi:hypothetical protein